MVSDETITLGDLAIHRKLRDGAIAEEWRSTRLRDEERCIAELVDWTVGTPPSGVSAHQERYQLDNMIHSSMMEVSGNGSIISYEEYAPFGATVYAAGTSFAEVSLKRYRYAGHDRDQATGLYYYGARYYAPWLLRWLSPDPAGDIDGINLYAFVGGNPVAWIDVGGFVKLKTRTKKDYKKYPRQSRAVSMKKRKADTTEVGMVIGALNTGAYGDAGKLVEVVQPLPEPASKRKRDRTELEDSVKNIDRQSLDTHKRAKLKKQSVATTKRRETEVIGETAALLKMVRQPNTHLAFAVDPGHGAGIDQLYYKQTAAAKKPSEYTIVEAKGPGAKLTNNAFSIKQMSPKWLKSRIAKLAKSGDPKRRAWGKKLDTALKNGTPKVYGMTVTARWNDKSGTLTTSQSKRKQIV